MMTITATMSMTTTAGTMVTMTTAVLIATTATMAITIVAPMAIVRFLLQNKLEMARFFQKTFWVVLEMSFLTLGSASLQFAEGELVWRTYMAVDNQADGTLRCKETCGCSPRGLWWSLVVHVASEARSQRPSIFTLFAKHKLSRSTLKRSSSQSLPYSDYTNVFSLQTLRRSYSSTPASMIILLTQ